MRSLGDSTLWSVSAFERVLTQQGNSGFQRLDDASVLPTSLLADLGEIGDRPDSIDVIEAVAACVRHREPALLCIECDGLIWPITIFPTRGLYHCPRDMVVLPRDALRSMRVRAAEPPILRPPGDYMHERIGEMAHYRPLAPLLWRWASEGPRGDLLPEIGGTAAYRIMSTVEQDSMPPLVGAAASAVERMRAQAVSLREVASWPGMSVERASRLLNGLYLSGRLMVSRSHPSARSQPGARGNWFGLRKPNR